MSVICSRATPFWGHPQSPPPFNTLELKSIGIDSVTRSYQRFFRVCEALSFVVQSQFITRYGFRSQVEIYDTHVYSTSTSALAALSYA